MIATNLPDLHVSFSLSKGGESIGLFAPDGREIDTVTFGAQTTDISEGRYPDGGTNVVVLPAATPGSQNTRPIEPPVLGEIGVDGTNLVFTWTSVDGDFYQVDFKDSLLDLTWTPLGAPIPGTGGMVGFSNSVIEVISRFYMLEVNP